MDTSTSSASARRPGGYAYTSGSKSDKVLYYINHAHAPPPPSRTAQYLIFSSTIPPRAVNVVRARHLTVMFTRPGQFKV